ncbi:MAG: 16S rRNA (cytosine(1402)-N(4))-methyltransferase RsmH [Pseudomonadota bacterium]
MIDGVPNHAPVLCPEMLVAMAPMAGETYVDGTLGAGGYTRALLDAAPCRVIGLDRDPDAVAAARDWGGAYKDRLDIVETPFSALAAALDGLGAPLVDGVVLDIGVSSMQLDQEARGFSFMRDGPLSMRMDQGAPTAADIVNGAEASDLAAIFRIYGEEKRAGALAKAIVKARATEPIASTGQLAEIIVAAAPPGPPAKIHPATRVFQALRIYVNDELGELARALFAIEERLRPNGRLAIVTFHSLEDRIVKRFLADRAQDPATTGSRHAPPAPSIAPAFSLRGKPITPNTEEIARNPRARSAKLRVALRTDAPARGGDPSVYAPTARLSKEYRSAPGVH